jgi:hypothetical protein
LAGQSLASRVRIGEICHAPVIKPDKKCAAGEAGEELQRLGGTSAHVEWGSTLIRCRDRRSS